MRKLMRLGREEVKVLEQEIGKPLTIDGAAIAMLSRISSFQPDSEEYMQAHLRILVDELIRRGPDAPSYLYEPPDANERRRAAYGKKGSTDTGEE